MRQEKVTVLPHSHQRSLTQMQTIVWLALSLALASPQSNVLLRSLDWIADYGAHAGGSVFLDMPEMGVEGQAEVLAIEPCAPLEEGEGRLVTGTFKHTSGEVYDLKLESESKPIGVTATHPFWSVDREAWVSAIDLEIGETLKTLVGTTVVESRSKREEPETVYNIEVEGDHCYRVGESGVLVHNNSADEPCSCRLQRYRDEHSGSSDFSAYVMQQEGIAGGSLWDIACSIGGDRPGTVAAALVCDDDEDEFKIVVASSRRDPTVASRARQYDYIGSNSTAGQMVHAEAFIMSRYSGSVIAIAASRCMCEGCQSVLGGATFESPADEAGRDANFPSTCSGRSPNRSAWTDGTCE